ncbi:ABC transporter ATP-binding protein [Marinobacter sp. C2H3]|uniref:ABC transporter ATP-binding protein n=1 Tax=Marinobacter sp. C2H3 TaxID=3119003 RepID=UPI00300F747F
MPAFFDVSNLQVRLGQTPILHGLDLTFRQGEVTALLGHNGSGKSTLLKVLGRHQRATAGNVRLQSQPLDRLSARQFARIVGYLPQHPPATDGLTVRELVGLGRYPWRGPLARYRSDDHHRIDRAIADTGLTAFADRSVDTLSGGERQRAWIALLLAQQTQCLLLDEPISALDVKHQVETLRLVRDLAGRHNLTVIVVLHDVDLAARFCDRLVALKEGRVVADGSAREIMNGPTLEAIFSVRMGVMERAPRQWISYVH